METEHLAAARDRADRSDTPVAMPISVVMPVRNVASYVEAAIHSVLAQQPAVCQLVVVDDGSDDGTKERIAGFSDSRVQVLSTPKLGAGAARNRGIRAAEAEWIAFIDGDDVWFPGKLATQCDAVRGKPGIDMVFTGCQFIDEAGKPLGVEVAHPGTHCFEQILRKNVIPCGSLAMVRKECAIAVGLFDETLPACIDYDFSLRVALHRKCNIHGIPQILASYRRRRDQITADWRRMESGWKQMLSKLSANEPARVKSLIGEATANFYKYLAWLALDQGDTTSAVQLARRAFASSPLHFLASSESCLLCAKLLLQRR